MAAVLGMTFQSCLMEEKQLFDKTPAERMDAYLSEFGQVLESSEGGWLLEYYAEDEQSYGGYPYILKFANGEVTAYFQLADDLEETKTSYYKLVADDGPVLTFDTYNEYIHYFSTPDIVNYQALQGDYEYRLVGKNDAGTELYVQGKRTMNNMVLRKFEGDPVEYLAKTLEVEAEATAPSYTFEFGDVKGVCALGGNYLEFEYTANEETVEGGSAFCFTDTGIRLYKAIEVDGVEITEFTFNFETSSMTSNTGAVKIVNVYPPLSEQITIGNWSIVGSGLGAYGQQIVNAVNATNIGALGGIGALILGNYTGSGWGLNLYVNAGYWGVYGIDMTVVADDKVTTVYNASKNAINANTFISYGSGQLLNFIGNGTPITYTLTADDVRKPNWIRFTDDSNPDNVITFVKGVSML